MALIGGKFCIDRWEASTVTPDGKPHSPHQAVTWKNVKAVTKPGVLAQAYISMEEADAACKQADKRLCTAQQWVDACMGTQRIKRTFPYGNEEKKGACNTQRPIHPSSLVHGNRKDDVISLNDPRLNQQKETVSKTGSFEECVTPDGVFDMHGNLLEWTRGTEPRPLLMGGHYVDGKIHGKGCTYVTDGHGPEYHDFTTGFRCCAQPNPARLQAWMRATAPATSAAPAGPVAPAAAATLVPASVNSSLQPSVGGKAPPPTDHPRDPPGMRSFIDPVGKLPEVKPPPYASEEAPCPVDMVHVEGTRCGLTHQPCLEWLSRRSAGKKISCKEFKAPTECKGAKRPMDYCIDRYEFQPEGYKYPLVSVSWAEAQNLCEAMDKRLCLESEWEFACEGEQGLPYPYGYVRDGKKCNHDYPEVELVTKRGDFIDRRVPKDALPECKSPFGVFNIVGNVDEWTTRYNAEPGHRGILRGGWWLIGRSRCRAATDNHGEAYGSMQTGFRCCKGSRKR